MLPAPSAQPRCTFISDAGSRAGAIAIIAHFACGICITRSASTGAAVISPADIPSESSTKSHSAARFSLSAFLVQPNASCSDTSRLTAFGAPAAAAANTGAKTANAPE